MQLLGRVIIVMGSLGQHGGLRTFSESKRIIWRVKLAFASHLLLPTMSSSKIGGELAIIVYEEYHSIIILIVGHIIFQEVHISHDIQTNTSISAGTNRKLERKYLTSGLERTIKLKLE